MTDASIGETARLLRDVFPEATIGDETYLRWLYVDAPAGPVIAENLHDEQGLSAHYAVVPVTLAIEGRPVAGALSLNTAVHERARGGGTFVRLATQTYEAAAAADVELVIGVANANSTPGFLRRLEFTNQGRLPATVLVPLPGAPRGGFRSAAASPDSPLLQGVEPLIAPPATGLTRRWSVDTLKWRLARPGAAYSLHRSRDLLLVTTTERRGPITIAVVLAAFAAEPVSPARARAAVRAACAHHRAAVALHVGVNGRVPFRGPPLPERFRASPLNLISRSLGTTLGGAAPPPSRFEFLDFDAY